MHSSWYLVAETTSAQKSFKLFIYHSPIPVNLLENLDADTPEFCYLLSSCSKRMIENVLCAIGANNFLAVKLFVPDLAACKQHCEDTEDCRFIFKCFLLCMKLGMLC